MHSTRKATAAAVTFLVVATAVGGCDSGSTTNTSTAGSREPGCPAVLDEAKQAVREAEDINAPWGGPTTGPEAVSGRTVAYVAQTMTNPGVSGVAKGVQEAAKVLGWDVRTIDGQGTPAGIRAAFAEALALKPSGIVIGGFDPKSVAKQVEQADTAGIPLIGWHATATPGPSTDPKLFSNVTTKVEEVAEISADWIIARSGGRAAWCCSPTPRYRSPSGSPI